MNSCSNASRRVAVLNDPLKHPRREYTDLVRYQFDFDHSKKRPAIYMPECHSVKAVFDVI